MYQNVLNSVIEHTSRKLGIDKDEVDLIYRSYWKFIREQLSKQPYKGKTEEEVARIAPNINISYIGKIYANIKKVRAYNKRLKNNNDAKY